MGSLIWAINLWAMRLAAGAAIIVAMTSTVMLYQKAEQTRDKVVVAAEVQKNEIADIFSVYD